VDGAWSAAEDSGRNILAGIFRMQFAVIVNGAVGVQELVRNVSENGGAARRNATLGDEDKKFGEEHVDFRGECEFGDFPEEFSGEIVGIRLERPRFGVPETKTGLSVQDAKTTLTAVESEMAAA
jgi:hypothetical protein